MNDIAKIIVPFDFSEAAINALEYTLNFVGYDKAVDIFVLQVTASPIDARKRKRSTRKL